MIVFRPIRDGQPDHWERDAHWFVEFHDNHRVHFHPLGIAFVTAFPNQVNLDAIIVLDQFRNRGIGTQLVRASLHRWPGILLSPAVAAFVARINNKSRRVPSQAEYACGDGRRPQ